MEAKTLFKFSLLLAVGLSGTSWAYPGMGKTLEDLSSLAKRQTLSQPELLADLAILDDDDLSPAGWTIKQVLLGNRTAVRPHNPNTVYTPPGPLGSRVCRRDTCCLWKYVADDMAQAFLEPSGECNDLARQAVRLGFHDAGSWSKSAESGGADGSIILAGEWMRDENLGLERIAGYMQLWYDKWNPYGAGMADLIQMASNVAAVSCPLGPRVRSFVGRPDSSDPEPEGLLPGVNADAASLVALFEDKTIVLRDLIALIGAHTTSIQRFVDPAMAGAPQDTTPGVWDASWYNETLDETSPPQVFRFESDLALARYPRAQQFWKAFENPANEQSAWNNVSSASRLRKWQSTSNAKTISGICWRLRPSQSPRRGESQRPGGVHRGSATPQPSGVWFPLEEDGPACSRYRTGSGYLVDTKTALFNLQQP
jgi:hypothetical protein